VHHEVEQAVCPLRGQEKFIQNSFKYWHVKRPQLADAPEWLSRISVESTARSTKAYGYSFRPDIVWPTKEATYIVELKHAAKYEPLALAEVLHHSFMLKHLRKIDKELPVKNVVVSRYSPWIRAAVAALGGRRASANICCLEVDVLRDGQLLWFDEPQQSWERVDGKAVPQILPSSYFADGWYWYFVEAIRTWMATRKPSKRRPILPSGQLVMLAEVSVARRNHMVSTQEYVLWQGRAPEEVSHRGPGSWKDSEYFLWSSSGVRQDPVPPIQPA
jgi:hypothetical protein